MTGLRILHVTNDLSSLGNGIVNAAVDLAVCQQHGGNTVAFAAATGGFQSFLAEQGVRLYEVDQSRTVSNLPRALVQFARVVREFRPDLIHAHMRTGLLLAIALRPLHRRPLVAHLHNVHDRESRWMRFADRVIAPSQSVRETIASQGISPAKVRVVLNGTRGSLRAASGSVPLARPLERPSIVTACGMNHRKGIAELLRAFSLVAAEFPESHLYLVGNGPERVLFEAQANALACRNRIHFEGYQVNPQAYMRAADIFVLASRRESFGLVLTEAREVGCAIIASDVDGIPEALDGGSAGMLVPPNDPDSLAAAFRLMLRDALIRQAWGRRAGANLERFTVERMAAEVLNVYRELLPPSGATATSLERRYVD